MTTAIAFHDVSKRYRLGEVGTGTLSHDLHRVWARLRGKPDPFAKIGEVNDREEAGGQYVWALKDISFEVQQGEILGIIGRNGAGKSTLLKLLSRVTAPTSGEIKARGRIASLLEVGTGFHPELTGRENIYLNGAILGMTRREVNSQLEAIVEFSGCAKYIDTPVKRYSSGMTVRLGFAVAAHLDCEVLVVDEVLAVGDAEFQRKCIGKMQEVSRGDGKTVLFVSHNMASIERLCTSGVVLSAGTVDTRGSQRAAIRRYHELSIAAGQVPLAARTDRRGDQQVTVTGVVFHDSNTARPCKVLHSGMDLTICFQYVASEPVEDASVVFAFNIRDERGVLLSNLNTKDAGVPRIRLEKSGQVRCRWPNLALRGGTYLCDVFCSVNDEIADWVEDAFSLQVEDADFYGTGSLIDKSQGPVLVPHSWSFH